MKARCIRKPMSYGGSRPYYTSPATGEIVEVIDVNEEIDGVWYTLAEYPGFQYSAYNFEILPDTPAEVIEEPEMIEA